MLTMTLSAIKGGVGKSSLTIATANILGNAGYKVLVMDLDIQNSVSFYYLDDLSIVEQKNIALALQEKNLIEHIVPTHIPNVEIIPSSFFLVDLRALSEHRLKNLMHQIEEKYDFCLIDTAPTYDNIVLNAINSSDVIITPVQLSQFNYKGAGFYREKLATETDKLSNWHIIINSFADFSRGNSNSLTSQYLELFQSEFDNILPVQIPRSSLIQRYIDTGETISTASRKKQLFEALKRLVEIICHVDLSNLERM